MSARVDDGRYGGWNGEAVEGGEVTQVLRRSTATGIAMVVVGVVDRGVVGEVGGKKKAKGGKSLTRLSVFPGAGANREAEENLRKGFTTL